MTPLKSFLFKRNFHYFVSPLISAFSPGAYQHFFEKKSLSL
ncbi:hypothetical protein FM106_27055 [Brachybacterium faecium]|nr:hypothetical protein FM106_27055 [Brachybacterium faecium]